MKIRSPQRVLSATYHGLARTSRAPLPTVAVALLSLLLALGPLACKKNKGPPAVPPPPTFTGPAFLHGTVQSLATLRGYHPLLVSMWGFVSHLDGTGSSEVPAFLRTWLINEMRRRGVGSYRLGTQNLTPAQLISSLDTAVVRIEGLIPPAALVGSRFDVLVTALPGTQTTSLEGGQLWTTDLSMGGANNQLLFSHKLAQASGPLYIDPFADPGEEAQARELRRRAIVLGGGVVTLERSLEIALNQPSGQRVQLIADRINERFPHERAAEFFNTALAENDLLVRIRVPKRFERETPRFLELIAKLYLDRAEQAQRQQAQRLIDAATADPRYLGDAALVWEGLGKTILPLLRPLYEDPNTALSLAALEAGLRLEDAPAADAILLLVPHPDPAIRRRAAQLLAQLPGQARASRALAQLVDDADQSVRLAAYDALAQTGNPLLRRIPVGEAGAMKFLVDLVPAQNPLVYITHDRIPRIAVFSPNAGFRTPLLARLWDNHLMLRSAQDASLVQVFYQPREGEPATFEIAPTVANLAILLAQAPSLENQRQGLDLSFSRVVNTIFELSQANHIDAPVDISLVALDQKVAAFRQQEVSVRPESEQATPATQPTDPLADPSAPATVPDLLTPPADLQNPVQ